MAKTTGINGTSLAGCMTLAALITAYWRMHGSQEIEAHAVEVFSKDDKNGPYVSIRSNLVNGMPPDAYRLRGKPPIGISGALPPKPLAMGWRASVQS